MTQVVFQTHVHVRVIYAEWCGLWSMQVPCTLWFIVFSLSSHSWVRSFTQRCSREQSRQWAPRCLSCPGFCFSFLSSSSR